MPNFNTTDWIFEKYMSNDEKERYPSYKITGGYLKMLNEQKSRQMWWDNLLDKEKDNIKTIPNFDAKIFEVITGIKTE